MLFRGISHRDPSSRSRSADRDPFDDSRRNGFNCSSSNNENQDNKNSTSESLVSGEGSCVTSSISSKIIPTCWGGSTEPTKRKVLLPAKLPALSAT
mmetsp:Transcript_96585/g.201836  ORF Transcript_96585/g.201836 Transcript_96585/m.201836 type:complete len:96 (-) Transcript_96585:942-1229(-)